MRIPKKNKKQVVVFHGGDTFETYKQYLSFLKSFQVDFSRMKSRGWKDNLERDLGKGFEVVLPVMPNKYNAKYGEWKIWWEKIIPFLESRVVLIGHSLGGIFLAKYLSENKFPKKILAVFLISAPFDDKNSDYSLVDFRLKKDLSGLADQSGRLFIWQSADDEIVPFVDLAKYRKSLPGAECREFKNEGHFVKERFPELVRQIRKIFV